MAHLLAEDAELHVATTAGGTYSCIGSVLTYSLRREAAQGGEKIKVLCNPVPISDAGEDSATLDITMLRDQADTVGQVVLATAKRNGTQVFIRALHGGPTVTGEQQAFMVDSHTTDVDANGTGANKFVRDSMTLTSNGPVTDVAGTP